MWAIFSHKLLYTSGEIGTFIATSSNLRVKICTSYKIVKIIIFTYENKRLRYHMLCDIITSFIETKWKKLEHFMYLINCLEFLCISWNGNQMKKRNFYIIFMFTNYSFTVIIICYRIGIDIKNKFHILWTIFVSRKSLLSILKGPYLNVLEVCEQIVKK